MNSLLDVFEVKQGQSSWLGCAESLGQGLELAVEYGDGLYCVFSPQDGHKRFYQVAQRNITPVHENDPGAS